MAKKAAETAKATTKKAAATKKENTVIGTTFSMDSLAREIAATVVDGDGKQKLSITEAKEVANAFVAGIAGALKKGQKVQLTGFLTISPSYRGEREGNNVATGEKMTIPESITFNAKVGKTLKDVAKELPADVFAAIKKEATK